MDKQLFEITPKTLQNQVVEKLREAILSGYFSIGQRLVEADLASLLSVSRAPIREALHQLVLDGLVDRVPHLGSSVHFPTSTEVREIQEIRGIIEGLAARKLAARSASEHDHSWFEEFDQLLQRMQIALDQHNLGQYFEVGRLFHERLVLLTSNEILAMFHTFVMNRAALFRQLSGDIPERQTQAMTEHVEIIQAIRDGNIDRAEQLVRLHSENGALSILKALSSRSQGKAIP
jgi:DNA-binding GntR family transcriptional regulator